ncbi:MAG TPA: PLP-dependent aminotransferase family protein [Chitinolyticbacter sp.]|nr:PLP-dependent aminotransferase family protein [Chitinolyticbacter sp.]
MFAERITRLTPSLVREILAVTQRPEVISFAGGLPAEDALFRPDPALLQGIPEGVWQYGQSEGEWRLRELVAARAAAMGLACSAEQVLILNGSQQGIDLVAKLMVEPGAPVLVEAPAYLAALQAFGLFGAQFLPFPVDPATGPDWSGLGFAALRARLCYLTPTFQNPSGYCYSADERERAATLLDAGQGVVFEDDPYRDLAYDGAAPAPLVARLERARWVYQGSFSKTLAPGLRLGYLIAHPELVVPLTRLKQAADLHSNRLSQHIVASVLEAGVLDAHVAGILPGYRARRDAMAASLTRHFGDTVRWGVPAGGLFFWVKLPQGVDSMALMRAALAEDVAVMPGVAFYPAGAQQDGWLRLNFSHASVARIDEGLAKLAALVDQQLRQVA